MGEFKRYALFVVPTGALYEAGAAWLGWDSVAGKPLQHPDIPAPPEPVSVLTERPRKYGFHGTVKPPFALADGHSEDALRAAVAAFCATQSPVSIPQLAVRRLGGFIAMIPSAPSADITALAAAAVEALDPFRAPPTETELAKRRKAGLSERQETLLQRWGYPYVMDAFRFHMTLTGRARNPKATCEALTAHFAPILPAPFRIDSLALMGEDASGQFHLIRRYGLSG